MENSYRSLSLERAQVKSETEIKKCFVPAIYFKILMFYYSWKFGGKKKETEPFIRNGSVFKIETKQKTNQKKGKIFNKRFNNTTNMPKTPI